MASRGAKVTLCEVAMLSICSGDMLAYYTAEAFVPGFKTRLANCNYGCAASRRTEAHQTSASGTPNGNQAAQHFAGRGGTHAREGHAVQGGNV